MVIRLGEKIKSLRKQKNISQEVLAQALGVTFQAVSKWETGATMPDVSMIPAIARFFAVSTDELFDYNLLEQEEKVMKICHDAAQFRFSDPEKSEAMLREGLRQFPGNDVILNNLLYTMQTPDRSAEKITICRSLIEITKYDDVRFDALRILAQTYHEVGQQALVKPTLEQIPEIYFSKLELMANLLDGQEAMDAARQHAIICRTDLMDMLSRLSQLHREQGDWEQANEYAELTRNVYHLFKDRKDDLGFDQDTQLQWLSEEIWPRLSGE